MSEDKWHMGVFDAVANEELAQWTLEAPENGHQNDRVMTANKVH